MIVLVKLEGPEYEKIRSLVKNGKFPSVEDFVGLAVRNQLVLESEGKPESHQSTSARVRTNRFSISVPSQLPKTIDPPKLRDTIRNSPLWGQVNRLAPAKFVLRSLLNYQTKSEESSVDLSRFGADAAGKASKFRIFAKRNDKVDRVRGEYLHVGFPRKTPSSQQRFLNYYVGKAPLQKWTDSIIVGLSMANIVETEEGSRVIGLTKEGLEFAVMQSPLIDQFLIKKSQIENPFSFEEVEFLLRQIKKHRPGELDFMKFTIDAIKKGDDTPTKLKIKIFGFLQMRGLEVKLTEKVANTMQVGMIGRLVEMGLIKIEKKALKSRYLSTKSGDDLLGK
jgi:hypothetical protein